MAVTYDGSGLASGVKIYVDGVLDTATTTLVNNLSGSIVSQGPLIVGNQAGYESQFALNGSLADFSISDVARSASYIAQNASFSSAPPVDAATVLAYSFSAGSGTEVQDLSADSYNATLSSSAMWSRGPALPVNSLTYTPAPGFTGTNSFSYTESNGTTGQVDVTVTPAIPVGTVSTAEGSAVSLNVLASNGAVGNLTLTGVTQGAHGTVTLDQGTAPAVQILQGQEINAGAVLAYEWNQPWTVMTNLNVGANPQAAAVIASNLSGRQGKAIKFISTLQAISMCGSSAILLLAIICKSAAAWL